MAKRLRNNLSKRRTRQNTLRRKGRKKYTRGGKPFRNPYISQKTQEQKDAELREDHAREKKLAIDEALRPYIREIKGLRNERDILKSRLEKLILDIEKLSQQNMAGNGFVRELNGLIKRNPI